MRIAAVLLGVTLAAAPARAQTSGVSTTSVRTALVASSQSLGGEQRDRVQCSTKGYLESWIRSRLLERIRRG